MIIGAIGVLILAPLVALTYRLLPALLVLVPQYASSQPPDPGFAGFDVCALITPRDAERAGARPVRVGPAARVAARVVRTTQNGVPIDSCLYSEPTAPSASLAVAGVRISVSPAAVIDHVLAGGRRLPMSGIGDEAHLVVNDSPRVTTVVVRWEEAQFAISAWLLTGEPKETRVRERTLVELARKVAGKLPANLTLPGNVAHGPCARINARALAAGLGGPVTYSRTHQIDDQTFCSYASAGGGALNVRLTTDVDDESLEIASYGTPIAVGSRTGSAQANRISFVEGKALLQVEFEHSPDHPDELTITDLVMAGAAADTLLGA